MEYRGVKYKYYRDPDVKDEVTIRSMISTLSGYREDLKKYPNDRYYAGQVAGMEMAMTHIGVTVEEEAKDGPWSTEQSNSPGRIPAGATEMMMDNPVPIRRIRTDLPGKRHFAVIDDKIGEPGYVIKIAFSLDKNGTPGYLVAKMDSRGEVCLVPIPAENVTGVIYADGTQVLRDRNTI